MQMHFSGTIDILAKVLEAGIIAGSVYIIVSIKKPIAKEKNIPETLE
jgi:hypothetical protein